MTKNAGMPSRRDWLSNELCSVAGTLEIMGERWTIMVLREAFLGTRRFDDFQRNIGCARNILSDRLQKLVAHGVLERRVYQERPTRYEYRLTQKGIDLWPAIIALMQWGDRYVAGARGPAIVIEHKACAHETSPELVCSHCKEPVDARAVRAHPGPGAITASA
jgi:DNA-binding HxlR family transcriptional regulator